MEAGRCLWPWSDLAYSPLWTAPFGCSWWHQSHPRWHHHWSSDWSTWASPADSTPSNYTHRWRSARASASATATGWSSSPVCCHCVCCCSTRHQVRPLVVAPPWALASRGTPAAMGGTESYWSRPIGGPNHASFAGTCVRRILLGRQRRRLEISVRWSSHKCSWERCQQHSSTTLLSPDQWCFQKSHFSAGKRCDGRSKSHFGRLARWDWPAIACSGNIPTSRMILTAGCKTPNLVARGRSSPDWYGI